MGPRSVEPTANAATEVSHRQAYIEVGDERRRDLAQRSLDRAREDGDERQEHEEAEGEEEEIPARERRDQEAGEDPGVEQERVSAGETDEPDVLRRPLEPDRRGEGEDDEAPGKQSQEEHRRDQGPGPYAQEEGCSAKLRPGLPFQGRDGGRSGEEEDGDPPGGRPEQRVVEGVVRHESLAPLRAPGGLHPAELGADHPEV